MVADTPHGEVRRGAVWAVSGAEGEWLIFQICHFFFFLEWFKHSDHTGRKMYREVYVYTDSELGCLFLGSFRGA